LGEVRHVFAFLSGDDEAYRVIAPFICEGFERGDKAVHVIREEERQAHLGRLRAAGIDTEVAATAGQLELRTSAETYLNGGAFDPDRMLAAFEAMASGNAGGVHRRSRIVCNMDWAAAYPATHRGLIEFEARVNEVWQRHDDIVICVYDQKSLSGEMVIDIMRTHPMVLIGDVLQHNPFYTPPAQFLRERGEAVGP
jgi:hypothetical protein